MPAPLLRIAHLTKKFGDATVVDDLSLEIMPGECLGVIGPNGAGKTTTIRVCLGLTGARRRRRSRPSACRCRPQVREAKKRIGVVTQFDSLDPDFTCAENLRVYGAYFGLSRAVIDERVPRLLEFAALQSKADAKPGELSGGMKRRLSLGRALVNDPDLLHPRRADHRPRSAGAPPDVGAAAEPAAARQGDPADDALHGRGRAPVRPPARPRPRQEDRRGHAAQADRRAPRERRRRGLRRRRRRRRRARTRRSPSASRPAARPSSSTCATPSRCSTRWPTTTAIRYLHRPANLEDLFLKLTGRQIRDDA